MTLDEIIDAAERLKAQFDVERKATKAKRSGRRN
jgi:hypothetical protein